MDVLAVDTGERAARVVAEFFEGPLDVLTAWQAEVASDIAEARRGKGLTAARLDDLVAPYARRTFEATDAPVYGAGFVAGLDLLSDTHGHLAWWQGEDRKKLVIPAQSSKAQLDYSSLEWYRVPMLTGETHVAGPYVDYLCSDEYTITLATPVTIDGEFVGVAALDLLVEGVEMRLTPALAELGTVTIVNGVGRIVISTDRRRATGDTLRGEEAARLTKVGVDGVALDVLVG